MTIEQAVAAERAACAHVVREHALFHEFRGERTIAALVRGAAEGIERRGECIDLAAAVRAYFEVLDAHLARCLDYAVVVEHEKKLRSLVETGEEEKA